MSLCHSIMDQGNTAKKRKIEEEWQEVDQDKMDSDIDSDEAGSANSDETETTESEEDSDSDASSLSFKQLAKKAEREGECFLGLYEKAQEDIDHEPLIAEYEKKKYTISKANRLLSKNMKKNFLATYEEFITTLLHLEKSHLHKAVVRKAKRVVQMTRHAEDKEEHAANIAVYTYEDLYPLDEAYDQYSITDTDDSDDSSDTTDDSEDNQK